VRSYASAYPKEVAGLVLADIVHEDQRLPMGPKAARVRDFATGRPIPKPREELSASDQCRSRRLRKAPARFSRRTPICRSESSACINGPSHCPRWKMPAHKKENLEDMPVVVLTRAEGYRTNLNVPAAELEEERKRLQAQLTRLSSHGSQVIVQGGHNMHLENPDAVVVQYAAFSIRSSKPPGAERNRGYCDGVITMPPV
jgi:pimeloyl-ACP methyl ester carboxylesterase